MPDNEYKIYKLPDGFEVRQDKTYPRNFWVYKDKKLYAQGDPVEFVSVLLKHISQLEDTCYEDNKTIG